MRSGRIHRDKKTQRRGEPLRFLKTLKMKENKNMYSKKEYPKGRRKPRECDFIEIKKKKLECSRK